MPSVRPASANVSPNRRRTGVHHAVCYGVPIVSDLPLAAGGRTSGAATPGCAIVLERSEPPPQNEGQSLVSLEIQGRQVASRFAPPRNSEVLGGAWRVFVEDVGAFEWHDGVGDRLRVWRGDVPDRVLSFWLVHLLLPAFLSSTKGLSFLHASAVELLGVCVAFLGPSHSGKSTLLAEFLKGGVALYCDDKLAIRNETSGVRAFAAHERYRPYRALESLGRCRARRVAESGQLKALLALERHPDTNKPEVVPLSGGDAFRRLIADHHLAFWQSRADQFQAVTHLSRSVPSAVLRVPDALDRLPEVTLAVEQYVESL